METVDELGQDTQKFHNYQRNSARQQQQKDAYLMKRVNRSRFLCLLIWYMIWLIWRMIFELTLAVEQFGWQSFSCCIQKAENQARKERGERPLPEEDLSKLFKPLQVPSRLDNLLLSGQAENYCNEINEFASQSFAKLFLSEALQDAAQWSKSKISLENHWQCHWIDLFEQLFWNKQKLAILFTNR